MGNKESKFQQPCGDWNHGQFDPDAPHGRPRKNRKAGGKSARPMSLGSESEDCDKPKAKRLDGGGPNYENGNSDKFDFEIERKFSTAVTEDKKEVKLSIDQFQLLKVLGRGSYGKVMLVKQHTDNKLYAMKILKKSELLKRNQIAHTKTERRVLQAVRHPFIVELKFAWQTRDKLYLVTDYAPGGELFFWLKRQRTFSQALVQLYAAELVLAIEHLHSKDVVYRDLKPENVLLDSDGHIKLTDFGLSKESVTGFGAEGGTQTFCGTPEYLAPEILCRAGHGKAVDWWSLGTLLYEMIAGLPPFYDTNVQTMYRKIMEAPLHFPEHFWPETKSLLSGMLQRDVTKRLGYRGANEIKAHPFFRGVDWDAVMAKKIEPMFRPPAPKDENDVRNFESEFTDAPPVDSYDDRNNGSLSNTAAERTHFEDFTYVGESRVSGGGSFASGSMMMEGLSFCEAK